MKRFACSVMAVLVCCSGVSLTGCGTDATPAKPATFGAKPGAEATPGKKQTMSSKSNADTSVTPVE